mgnify:CR=1 FL=1
MFATLEITRGWLSNGISSAMTINGGNGNDDFTVFHNKQSLTLAGGDGDDTFTVRAFALVGSVDDQRARTDMKGDAGADTIKYAVNAPVGIDGGDGFDTVVVIGTEFSDDFVVTDAGVFGAGLNVTYVNIEKLKVDGAEGDDRYFVLSTNANVVTEIDGGLGSDHLLHRRRPGGLADLRHQQRPARLQRHHPERHRELGLDHGLRGSPGRRHRREASRTTTSRSSSSASRAASRASPRKSPRPPALRTRAGPTTPTRSRSPRTCRAARR